MYYNTVSTSGQLLLEYRESAKKQEDNVMDVFRFFKKPMSPSEVHQVLIGSEVISKDTPLTSIRRAISDLTKELKLTRTEVKVIGKYGRSEFKWQIV